MRDALADGADRINCRSEEAPGASDGRGARITERRQIEEALRESEARLRFAVAAAGLASWEIGLDTGVARRSARTRRASLELEEFPLSDFIDHIHPEDRAEVEGRLARMAERRLEEFAIEYRLRVTGQEGWHWAETHGTVADRDNMTGLPVRIAGVTRDITERKQAEERQKLLAREVDHRAKNALAVVQAALRLTSKEDPAAYMHGVEGRVAALAHAQTLLARGRWSGTELRALLEGELAPSLVEGASAPHARLIGPSVMLWPEAAQALSMAVHELATNAVKHGALGRPGRTVTVHWRVELAERLHLYLKWQESGGPQVPGSPSRRGFGTRVLDGTVRAQLGGKVRQGWSAEGIKVELKIPLLGGSVPPPPTDVAMALRQVDMGMSVPALLAGAYFESRARERLRLAGLGAEDAAKASAREVDDLIVYTRMLVTTLAAIPEVRRGEGATCADTLRRLLPTAGWLASPSSAPMAMCSAVPIRR